MMQKPNNKPATLLIVLIAGLMAVTNTLDAESPCDALKMKPEDGAAGDQFGSSVAISGGTVVVGAYGDDDNGFDSGSAYLFWCACPADIDGDGAVNVSDLVEVITNWSECENCPADVNGDGLVDVLDLIEVILSYG